jgi:hypothetical protein
MKAETRQKLQAAKDYCDENDKSTEFIGHKDDNWDLIRKGKE